MHKRTPLGGARGIEAVLEDGSGPVLETGTASEECMILKELLAGPKGKKGVVWVSEPMIEVPLAEWLVVTTRGGDKELEDMMLDCKMGLSFF